MKLFNAQCTYFSWVPLWEMFSTVSMQLAMFCFITMADLGYLDPVLVVFKYHLYGIYIYIYIEAVFNIDGIFFIQPKLGPNGIGI